MKYTTQIRSNSNLIHINTLLRYTILLMRVVTDFAVLCLFCWIKLNDDNVSKVCSHVRGKTDEF